ncbi:MAG: DUF6442 family protein [Acutalibacteraceae bacterium]|nr:DUF6442 family protein [Acutalibacteraceae bacterium]
MNKEEILKLSQQENQGKPDELELNAIGKASRAGMVVGGILCVILVLVSRWVLNRPELALAGWMIYFAMQASNKIAMYVQLKNRTSLFCGIMYVIATIGFAVAMVSVIISGV